LTPHPARPIRTPQSADFSSQFGIGKPPSDHLRHCQREPICVRKRIVLRCAIVEPERLLVYACVKVKLFDGNVGSAQGPLQQAPEVLDAVSVDVAPHVLFDMVHGVVNKLVLGKAGIASLLVCVYSGLLCDAGENFILQRLAVYVRDYLRPNLPGQWQKCECLSFCHPWRSRGPASAFPQKQRHTQEKKKDKKEGRSTVSGPRTLATGLVISRWQRPTSPTWFRPC
jgi:hypothetical protein